ncbi:site-specific integrase [Kitasatospora sp. NPDC048296]|uniref:site-specific integrase n=1 Tax=Kitasatospora sp. NPDC048296 TaxID=3364048 RepID=UPI0037172E3F
MYLSYFSPEAWTSWEISAKPVIPAGMPVLVDDDLLFEDPAGQRRTVLVNRWLRELPASGCPSPRSWEYYARVLRDWMAFLAGIDVDLCDERAALKGALSAYADHRAAGPLEARFEVSTWNQHVSILSAFYRWAVAEGHARAEPFTYKAATVIYADQVRTQAVNLASRRAPKPHVTVKHLEGDFAELFLKGLRGLAPDGEEDRSFRGRDLGRNAAIGGLALATGLRLQEFTYLLSYEIPPLPSRRTSLPIAFPVPSGVTKGRKFRTTWISYEALAAVHQYLELDRAVVAEGSGWRPPRGWGGPLTVTDPDHRGGRVNGVRVRWEVLTPAERRRLVAAEGGACLLALKSRGGPFTAWSTVFERTSERIRQRWEPRFPHVHPHRLRHSFSLRTLELLVSGYYRQAAKLVAATDTDAALALYLAKADPLMVLRDLLGHSSVRTTESYLRRLDMTRVYQDAYRSVGEEEGLLDPDELVREVAEEFADEEGEN